MPSSGRRPPWSFRRDGQLIELDTQGAFTCLGDFLATSTLVRHGGGLMQAYRFTVQDALDSGELVEVLADFGGTSRPFMLVYPQARHMPLKVRVFIDFLVANGLCRLAEARAGRALEHYSCRCVGACRRPFSSPAISQENAP
jgi:DNA-binding transcriptional LysR family regulator